MRNEKKSANSAKRIFFPFAVGNKGQKLFVDSVPLKKLLNSFSRLEPSFAVDQLFKDVFHNLPPIAEDLSPEEQQQRLKTRLMMQDFWIELFGSMELKGGHQ